MATATDIRVVVGSVVVLKVLMAVTVMATQAMTRLGYTERRENRIGQTEGRRCTIVLIMSMKRATTRRGKMKIRIGITRF